MSLWHYLDNGEQKGPVEEEQLRTMISTGRVRAQDMVWTEGMEEWQPVGNLPNFECPASPTAPPPTAGSPAQYASQGGSALSQSIPNYLPWAIAATILCCVPTGIAAIVYSTKATNAQNVGNYAEATKAAASAKLWLIISVVVGLVVTVLGVALQILAAVATA